jgi:hypothetical protein
VEPAEPASAEPETARPDGTTPKIHADATAPLRPISPASVDDENTDEKTRIGVPAYQATAKLATEVAESQPYLSDSGSLRPAQAVRVVVWRGPDGVHVAPLGTRVTAISIDAILVALDPSADLASWLSEK